MKHTSHIAVAVAATAVFAADAVFAQTGASQPAPSAAAGHVRMMGQGMGHGPDCAGHGPMMGQGGGMRYRQGAGNRGPMAGPTAMLTKQDAGSAADMSVVMDLVHNHTQIKRTVTMLPDGIRTVTESDDPNVAQAIKAHVASMSNRLKDGRKFNIFSTTLPAIFDNAHKIKSVVEMTDKGAVVTRTAADFEVVAALQAHAGEVTELVQDGMAGMRRGMMARMAMGPGGPRGAMRPVRPGNVAPSEQHAH